MDNLKPHLGSWLDYSNLLTHGLVGYWPFTKTSDIDLRDFSLFGNHGVINGAIWQGAGLVFDGDLDDVNINPLRFPDDQGNWSLGGIIHPTSAGEVDGGRIAESTPSFRFRFSTAGGGLHLTRFTSGTDGVWQNDAASGLVGNRSHFFLTQEMNLPPKIYVNGVFKYELTEVTPPTGTPVDLDGTDFYFFSNGSHSRALDGTAEQFLLYNRVLSAAEVRSFSISPNQLIFQFDPWLYQAAEALGGIPILRRRRECA